MSVRTSGLRRYRTLFEMNSQYTWQNRAKFVESIVFVRNDRGIVTFRNVNKPINHQSIVLTPRCPTVERCALKTGLNNFKLKETETEFQVDSLCSMWFPIDPVVELSRAGVQKFFLFIIKSRRRKGMGIVCSCCSAAQIGNR